jgi:hypothetical protein
MKKLLAVLIFLLAPTLAHASPVTFGITGTIHKGVRGPFSGSYTFDSLTYVSPGSVHLDMPSGTLDWQGEVSIRIENDVHAATPTFLSDRYTFVSDIFVLVLYGCHGGIFNSTALPLTPPDLAVLYSWISSAMRSFKNARISTGH